TGLALADVDRDGAVDVLFAPGESNGIGVLLGVGDGTFLNPYEIATTSASGDFVVADLNGDNFPDLVSSENRSTRVYFGNGDGAFGAPVTASGASGGAGVAVADLNGDGTLDIVSSEFSGGEVEVILNNGDGS